MAIRTLTFLFTDIEGSTKLVTQLGIERWEDVLRDHATILKGAIEGSGGGVVRTEGDAFFAVFEAPSGAARAAATAEKELTSHTWPHGVEVRVRMGMHTGEGKLGRADTAVDYIGLDVHRAARVAACAHGGQVLLSSATESVIRYTLPDGATLRDLGVHRLKDLSEPERLYQLVVDGAPSEFPPPRTLSRGASALPVQPTTFVGREREIAEVRGLLERGRLVTLVGSGGTGKTRLALQVAAEIADEFGAGVWFVPLESASASDAVMPAIASALGLAELPGRSLGDVVHEFLRDRALLLVLDNFEQALAAAPLVAEILSSAGRVKLVLTSRIALRISAERQYPVPPLPVPDPRDAGDPAALAASPSVELFLLRARAVRPDFALTQENAGAVAGICARLDGLPLAIELAAARVNVLAPPAILQRLARSLDLLTTGGRDRADRQRTLRGAISWSYDLLDPDARRLFERFSVFAGGTTLELVEAVCGDGAPAFDELTTLVEHSLVQQREVSGEARFGMLATIREFASERLPAAAAETIRRGHATAFLELAERAYPEIDGPRQAEWISRLEMEHDNFRAALAWADAADPPLGLRLATRLTPFWTRRGHLTEGRERITRALAATAADDPARPRALYEAGWLALNRDGPREAEAYWREGVPRARELGDRETAARTLTALASAAFYQVDPGRHDYSSVRALLEDALAEQRQLGDLKAEASSLQLLAFCLQLEGDIAGAVTRYEASIAIRRRIADEAGEAEGAAFLGLGLAGLDRIGEAAALLRRALAIQSKAQTRPHTAFTLTGVSRVALRLGRHRDALLLHSAALAVIDEIHFSVPPVMRAEIEADGAAARLALGDDALAVEAEARALGLERAVELAESVLRDAAAWYAAPLSPGG